MTSACTIGLVAITLAACSAPDRIATPSLSAIDAAVVNQTSDIVPGYVRVCKAAGPAGTYTFNVSATGGGTGFFTWGPVVTLNFDGTNLTCNSAWIPFVHDGSWDSDPVAQVTVSENVPDGMSVPEIKVFHTALQTEPSGFAFSLFNTNTVTVPMHRSDLAKLIFYNIENPPPPPPHLQGRMTGGGNQITVAGVRVSRGFTIHCDITLSNNIEINWNDNHWHIDKPITSAICIDDPAYQEKPPRAPFNTFIGTAVGRLNGVDGSLLEFTFIDDGEPGKNDLAAIRIRDANGAIVLNIDLTKLDHGNIQAHYDQPHVGNGNK